MLLKNDPDQLFVSRSKPRGEPFVWFTAIGLALGLMMIIFLLSLIVVRGTEVFWPKNILMFKVQAGGEEKLMAGELRLTQEKLFRVAVEGEDTALNKKFMEWQLFVGNKEVVGLPFVFVDRNAITDIETPLEIMRIERVEYGDALGFPVALKQKDGTVLEAHDAAFEKTLHEAVKQGNRRWKIVTKIEKKEIGLISYKMSRLQLKKKSIARTAAEGEDTSEKLRAIEAEMTELEAKYKDLAAKSFAIRSVQGETVLQYRLVTGEEKEIPAGNIVHFYYPNQLNVFEKTGMFFFKIARFLTDEPREANTEGGVFPAIFGTFVMTVLMSMAVMPFGVLAAIYLREYAKQGFFVRAVRIAVNNLAGVPSIVFGVFGLGFFVYFVGGSIDRLFFKDALPTPTFGTGGIIWAALTLALLTVPVVIVATEEALASVPRGMREGSLACGSSKWQTIKNIVLPAAAPGILTGLILSMARGASEVAPLMLVGVVKLAPNLPVDGIFPFVHLERKFMHLGFHIYDLGFQSPDSEAAKPMVFATTLLLIGLVVVLNLGAILLREKVRKKYATGAF